MMNPSKATPTLAYTKQKQVVVIGAGLAGMTSAIRLAENGLGVTLVHFGIGGLPLSPGTIDIFGNDAGPVSEPFAAIEAATSPHPYALLGKDAVQAGVQYFAQLVGAELLEGDAGSNILLPTAVGALRPTALVAPTMIAGSKADKKVIVGFTQLKDFPAALIAGNLGARSLTLDFPARDGETESSAVNYARAFDDPSFRLRFTQQLRPLLEPAEIVGLPAVLGLADRQAWRDIAERLGTEIFEIPTVPPSVPGIRLHQELLVKAKNAGVSFISGSRVTSFAATDNQVTAIQVAAAGAPQEIRGDYFVLATGGFESQGLVMDSSGVISEPVFNLPIDCPTAEQLVTADFWADQPIFQVGLKVNSAMHPVDVAGKPVFDNLYAAGGIIGGANRIKELSGDGIALASAWVATNRIINIAEGRNDV